jgi:hypothetical protein
MDKIKNIYNQLYNFIIPYPLKEYNYYNKENEAKSRISFICLFITSLFIIIYFFYGQAQSKYKTIDKIQVLPKYISFNQFSEFSTFQSSNPINRY